MTDKDQSVTVAASAGFCPGVKKAIDAVLELESSGKKPVYTIGPLIHNRQVTENLEAKGITSIEKLEEATDKNGVLVIRAHGITPQFQKEVESMGMQVVDATCPLVKNVQRVITEYAAQGFDTVIIGDAGHAEVTGLLGYTQGKGAVVGTVEEAQKLPHFKKVNIVSQTTQKEETFYKIADIIKAKADICQISNTICHPTKQRQKETMDFAKNADLVIVVGGKHSANTARLALLCSELCPKVLHIEKAEELSAQDVKEPAKIFITAGASTPNWVIDNVAAQVRSLRSKDKINLPQLFKNIWSYVINTSVFTSFAAVCLTYVCMQLQGATRDISLYMLSGLFVFALTLINKGGTKVSKRNNIITSLTAALFTFWISLQYGAAIYLPMFIFLALGILYPFRHKLTRFAYLPGTKDIVTALGWCFVCVYIPAQTQDLLLRKSAYLAFTYGLLLVFIRSVILSIGAESKDIILGKESFYKAFGPGGTKIVIGAILFALTAVLVWLLMLGWKVKLVSVLLLGNLYTAALAVYCCSRKTPRTIAGETAVDGQFYLLALLSFTVKNLI